LSFVYENPNLLTRPFSKQEGEKGGVGRKASPPLSTRTRNGLLTPLTFINHTEKGGGGENSLSSSRKSEGEASNISFSVYQCGGEGKEKKKISPFLLFLAKTGLALARFPRKKSFRKKESELSLT